MNFKIGDKVVVIHNDHHVSVGMKGVIRDIYNTTVCVDFGGHINRWWMFPRDLDFSKEQYLIKFYEEITSTAVAH